MNNLFQTLNSIAENKLEMLLQFLTMKLGKSGSEEVEKLDEANFRIVRARIRGGKIQRKKKVSTRKGYTIRNNKLIRMSSGERLRRRRGARKGKVKRKAKRARMLMRRKRSLRKRASLGV